MAMSDAEQAWAVTSDIAGAVVSDIAGAIEAALAEARAPLEAEVERLTRERDEARDDSLRLHKEKCDHMDRWIAAKVRLARARADALREAGNMPVWFGQTPDGVDRDSWLKGAEQAISAYCKAIRALADSKPAGRVDQEAGDE